MKKLNLHQFSAVASAAQQALGQFIFPTGTGKTLIEARIIGDHIKRGEGSIFVVLAPRIMLAQQLFTEIWEDLVESGRGDVLFFGLHSGKKTELRDVVEKLATKKIKKDLEHCELDVEDQDDELDVKTLRTFMKENGIPSSNFRTSTKKSELVAAVADASSRGVPLVICSTYHSSPRLDDLDIDVLIADEAHNTVSLEFSSVHELNAQKRFYFTATPKNTTGVRGMNNTSLFGEVLGKMSAAEAVTRKLILRPRIHYVKTSVEVTSVAEGSVDARAIEESFEEHGRLLRIGAKMLVACRGTSAMKKLLAASNYFERLRRIRPGLQIFSIISDAEEGAKINGESVAREKFMSRLKTLKDQDQAILLHYDILSEGIDIPGITGVMPLRMMVTSKFLQMLGRACRLHPMDRECEDAKVAGERWDEQWVKPYAWLILPTYGKNGDEQESVSEKIIKNIRDYGFIPGEDEFFSEAGGDAAPVPVETMYDPKKKNEELMQFCGTIVQRLENKLMAEAYEELAIEDCL